MTAPNYTIGDGRLNDSLINSSLSPHLTLFSLLLLKKDNNIWRPLGTLNSVLLAAVVLLIMCVAVLTPAVIANMKLDEG